MTEKHDGANLLYEPGHIDMGQCMLKPLNMKRCPQCGKVMLDSNYCSQCGAKLVDMPKFEETCPCCGGTGKIKRYSEPWYRWQASQPPAVINQQPMNNAEHKE